jgi:hypothetical protein
MLDNNLIFSYNNLRNKAVRFYLYALFLLMAGKGIAL